MIPCPKHFFSNSSRLLLLLTLFIFAGCFLPLAAQTFYGNEWINTSKNYYKIKVGAEGIYRISQQVLSTTKLGLTGSHYQLFCNGKEVPLYVTTSNELGTNDYIEFYGQPNNGQFDTLLYANANWQPNPYINLFTDTATYYLTTNIFGFNERYFALANDTINAPTAPTWFWYTQQINFKNTFHPGIITQAGSFNAYSPSFDLGEGYCGALITKGNQTDLKIATPAISADADGLPQLQIGLMGRSEVAGVNPDHHFKLKISTTTLIDNTNEGYFLNAYTTSFDPSLLTSPQTTLALQALGDLADDDKISANWLRLTYPRLFDFENKKGFSFELLNDNTYLLEIVNFNAGTAPVLYDLTNRLRIPAITQAGKTIIKLPKGLNPSVNRKLYLANTTNFIPQTGAVITQIENLIPVPFYNFEQEEDSLQGDFCMVYHPDLAMGDVNQVERYLNYRKSPSGGNFTAAAVSIETLYDQFAYGTYKSPLAIRNFVNYAIDKWKIPPKQLLLLGKGVSYNKTTLDPTAYKACLVPTYGYQPSDVLLTARSATQLQPQLPIGRVSASNAAELKAYLNKLMQHESPWFAPPSCDTLTYMWRKNVLQLVQGSSAPETNTLTEQALTKQPLYKGFGIGAQQITLLAQKGDVITELPQMTQLINQGLGLITFTGGANAGSLAWNFYLLPPDVYNNEARYPVVISNAGSVGNLFNYGNNQPMSITYVMAQNAGFIGFVDKSFIIPQAQAQLFADTLLAILTQTNYGLGLGQAMLLAGNALANNPNLSPAEAQLLAQAFTLSGDPLIQAVPNPRGPELAIYESQTRYNSTADDFPLLSTPLFITEKMPGVNIKFVLHNYGQYVNDSVWLHVGRIFEDASLLMLDSIKVPIPAMLDTLELVFKNDFIDLNVNGSNVVAVFADFAGKYNEACKTNNVLYKPAEIHHYCTAYPNIPLEWTEVNPGGFPILLDAGEDGTFYTWSTGETTRTITVTQPGLYAVTVTDAFDCTAEGKAQVVFTNIFEQEELQNPKNDLQILYFPDENRLQIIAHHPDEKLLSQKTYSLQLVNAQGKIMLQHNVLPSDLATANGTTINLPTNLPVGWYLTTLYQEQRAIKSQKLLLNHRH